MRFYYYVWKPSFFKAGSALTMNLYQDTDSILSLHTWPNDNGSHVLSFYIALRNCIEHLDLAAFPENHPVFTWGVDDKERERLLNFRAMNRKKSLCFSPETASNDIVSFVGLRCKSYSLATKNIQTGAESWKFAFKGASKKSLLIDFKHERFLRFLLEEKKFALAYTHRNIFIKDHELYLKTSMKKFCNRYYDKRFLLYDGITSLAYGNPEIKFYKEIESILEHVLDLVCGADVQK